MTADAIHPELAWYHAPCESGSCIEVAMAGSAILVRDSTDPLYVLQFERLQWGAFIAGIKMDDFTIS